MAGKGSFASQSIPSWWFQTPLKNISQNGFIFPKFRVNIQQYLKPTPSFTANFEDVGVCVFFLSSKIHKIFEVSGARLKLASLKPGKNRRITAGSQNKHTNEENVGENVVTVHLRVTVCS